MIFTNRYIYIYICLFEKLAARQVFCLKFYVQLCQIFYGGRDAINGTDMTLLKKYFHTSIEVERAETSLAEAVLTYL